MGGIPFPIPKDGNEAIWNATLRYHGDTFAQHWAQAAVTRTGDYALVKFEYEYDFQYGNCSKPVKDREPNKVLNYLQITTAPARLAGQILLVHETVDQAKEPRSAWTYNPGQRRVRLAPNVAYDNPGTAADGLRTNDDFGMYNGATDRYNWKLVGKKEMYVPYNSYRLTSPDAQVRRHPQARPHQPGPRALRAAPRLGGRGHAQARARATSTPSACSSSTRTAGRRSLTDKYDGRGELWRFSEQHNENWYNIPMFFGTIEVHNDLQSGRYIAMGLRNEETKIYEADQALAAPTTPEQPARHRHALAPDPASAGRGQSRRAPASRDCPLFIGEE